MIRLDGVTVLDLLLALALMALLCCIGVPSFSSIRQEQQLLAAAHALRADIELARHEAQQRQSSRIAIYFFTSETGWCYRVSDLPDRECNSCAAQCDLAGDGHHHGRDQSHFPQVTMEEISYLGKEMGIGERHGTLSPGHIRFQSGESRLKVITSGLGRVRLCGVAGSVAGVMPCN